MLHNTFNRIHQQRSITFTLLHDLFQHNAKYALHIQMILQKKKWLQNNHTVQMIKALLNICDYSIIILVLSCQKKKNTNHDHLKVYSQIMNCFCSVTNGNGFFWTWKTKTLSKKSIWSFSSASTAEVEGTLPVICDYEGSFRIWVFIAMPLWCEIRVNEKLGHVRTVIERHYDRHRLAGSQQSLSAYRPSGKEFEKECELDWKCWREKLRKSDIYCLQMFTCHYQNKQYKSSG